jgi:hypothetical protein
MKSEKSCGPTRVMANEGQGYHGESRQQGNPCRKIETPYDCLDKERAGYYAAASTSKMVVTKRSHTGK